MDPRRRFEDVYEKHEGAVRAFALRRLGASGADDVVSEVFVAAWRRVDELPGDDPLPWLLGIARGVISNRRRAEGRSLRLIERLSREPVRADGEQPSDLDLGIV